MTPVSLEGVLPAGAAFPALGQENGQRDVTQVTRALRSLQGQEALEGDRPREADGCL